MAAPREAPSSPHHRDGTGTDNAPRSNFRQPRDAQPVNPWPGQATSGLRFVPDVTFIDQPLVYTSVDPFRLSAVSSGTHFGHSTPQGFSDHSTSPLIDSSLRLTGNTYIFGKLEPILVSLFYTLPQQLYLHFLFRLPAFYFTRVAQIFEEAELTMSEIKQMAAEHRTSHAFLAPSPYGFSTQTPKSNLARLTQLRATWAAFIDSLLREWKTLNIVSVLLLSAIISMLQIESAANDPIARHAALFSLICALMSLLYGCMYIIRFGNMKGARKAVEWAAEGQKTKTLIWWNVWVLLSMPAAWLAWSILLYVVCVMAFIWRTESANDISPPLSSQAVFGLRIALSTVLALGVIYLILILHTLRRYGNSMHKAWKARVDGWAAERRTPPRGLFHVSPMAANGGPAGQHPFQPVFQPYRVQAPTRRAAPDHQAPQPPYEPSPWLPANFDGTWRFQAGAQPQTITDPVGVAPGPGTRPARGGHRQEAVVGVRSS